MDGSVVVVNETPAMLVDDILLRFTITRSHTLVEMAQSVKREGAPSRISVSIDLALCRRRRGAWGVTIGETSC